MAAQTATIRVAREIRDLLAQQARERGISLSAMLAEFARGGARDAILRSEREASRADADDFNTAAEERDWEVALRDGFD